MSIYWGNTDLGVGGWGNSDQSSLWKQKYKGRALEGIKDLAGGQECHRGSGNEGGEWWSEKLSQLQPPFTGSGSLAQGMWLSQQWDSIQFTVQTVSPGPSRAERILSSLDWEPKARARNWQVPTGIRGLWVTLVLDCGLMWSYAAAAKYLEQEQTHSKMYHRRQLQTTVATT